MNPPQQAVILCGGLGTRLRPLTDTLPKPMVSVNGKPFLDYLIEQMRAQGILRILLLTGYRGEMIREYLNTSKTLGVEISYSHGPADWDTGRRIWEARQFLDLQFLLLYSDNFVQFNLKKLTTLHHKNNKPITLLLAAKEKGNIRISADGKVEAYDKTRSESGFDYVEIGYMLIDRDLALEDFPTYANFPDLNFSVVLQEFALKGKISGLIAHDSYHSISDLVRLQSMREYLRPKRILLIDRDGTINVKAPPGQYIASWNNFEWIPETRLAMKRLARAGFKFIVLTNQAGVARGMIDSIDLEIIHKNMIASLASEDIDVLKVYCCPDHWEANSFMRKPAPGMFFQAANEYLLRLDRCFYVGDDERDCQAAFNAGCAMVYLSDDGCEPPISDYPVPFLSTKSLLDAVESIEKAHAAWEVVA
jgi:D-glycero-D-manno-heptose 1,7-bisphosphate phosphatase